MKVYSVQRISFEFLGEIQEKRLVLLVSDRYVSATLVTAFEKHFDFHCKILFAKERISKFLVEI